MPIINLSKSGKGKLSTAVAMRLWTGLEIPRQPDIRQRSYSQCDPKAMLRQCSGHIILLNGQCHSSSGCCCYDTRGETEVYLKKFHQVIYLSIAIDGSVMGVVEISSPSGRCFEVEDLS